MKYKVEVHSEGYVDHTKILDVRSLAIAKQGFNVNSAIIEWCDKNDIDVDSMDLPFTRVSKCTDNEVVAVCKAQRLERGMSPPSWDSATMR